MPRCAMAKKFPRHPKHPERICWGCDKYCPSEDLGCGNGSDRTLHPMELFGEDWLLDGDSGLTGGDETGATSASLADDDDAGS